MTELRPILEEQSMGYIGDYVRNIKRSYTHDWIFSKIHEKLIVFGSFAWSVFCIGRYLWHLM